MSVREDFSTQLHTVQSIHHLLSVEPVSLDEILDETEGLAVKGAQRIGTQGEEETDRQFSPRHLRVEVNRNERWETHLRKYLPTKIDSRIAARGQSGKKNEKNDDRYTVKAKPIEQKSLPRGSDCVCWQAKDAKRNTLSVDQPLDAKYKQTRGTGSIRRVSDTKDRTINRIQPKCSVDHEKYVCSENRRKVLKKRRGNAHTDTLGFDSRDASSRGLEEPCVEKANGQITPKESNRNTRKRVGVSGNTIIEQTQQKTKPTCKLAKKGRALTLKNKQASETNVKKVTFSNSGTQTVLYSRPVMDPVKKDQFEESDESENKLVNSDGAPCKEKPNKEISGEMKENEKSLHFACTGWQIGSRAQWMAPETRPPNNAGEFSFTSDEDAETKLQILLTSKPASRYMKNTIQAQNESFSAVKYFFLAKLDIVRERQLQHEFDLGKLTTQYLDQIDNFLLRFQKHVGGIPTPPRTPFALVNWGKHFMKTSHFGRLQRIWKLQTQKLRVSSGSKQSTPSEWAGSPFRVALMRTLHERVALAVVFRSLRFHAELQLLRRRLVETYVAIRNRVRLYHHWVLLAKFTRGRMWLRQLTEQQVLVRRQRTLLTFFSTWLEYTRAEVGQRKACHTAGLHHNLRMKRKAFHGWRSIHALCTIREWRVISVNTWNRKKQLVKAFTGWKYVATRRNALRRRISVGYCRVMVEKKSWSNFGKWKYNAYLEPLSSISHAKEISGPPIPGYGKVEMEMYSYILRYLHHEMDKIQKLCESLKVMEKCQSTIASIWNVQNLGRLRATATLRDCEVLLNHFLKGEHGALFSCSAQGGVTRSSKVLFPCCTKAFRRLEQRRQEFDPLSKNDNSFENECREHLLPPPNVLNSHDQNLIPRESQEKHFEMNWVPLNTVFERFLRNGRRNCLLTCIEQQSPIVLQGAVAYQLSQSIKHWKNMEYESDIGDSIQAFTSIGKLALHLLEKRRCRVIFYTWLASARNSKSKKIANLFWREYRISKTIRRLQRFCKSSKQKRLLVEENREKTRKRTVLSAWSHAVKIEKLRYLKGNYGPLSIWRKQVAICRREKAAETRKLLRWAFQRMLETHLKRRLLVRVFEAREQLWEERLARSLRFAQDRYASSNKTSVGGATILAKVRYRVLVQTLNAWRQYTVNIREDRTIRALEDVAQAYHETALKSCCMEHWKRKVSWKRKMGVVAGFMLVKRQRIRRKIFHAWASLTRSSVEKIEQFQQHWQVQVVSKRAFKVWRYFAIMEKHLRREKQSTLASLFRQIRNTRQRRVRTVVLQTWYNQWQASQSRKRQSILKSMQQQVLD